MFDPVLRFEWLFVAILNLNRPVLFTPQDITVDLDERIADRSVSGLLEEDSVDGLTFLDWPGPDVR